MARMTAVEMAAALPVGELSVVLTYGTFRGAVGVVVVVNGVLAGAVSLADVRGNVRVFLTATAALDEVAKILQIEDGVYNVIVNSGGYLLETLPVDFVASAKSRRDRLAAARVKNLAYAAALGVQIAAMTAWGVRSAAQGLRLAELNEQVVALAAERVSIDAQLVDLDALILAAV